jgi:hypothetical protein
MLLTSAERLMQYTELVDQAGDAPVKLRDMKMWLTGTSARIESYLNRQLHIEQRTDYFDSYETQIEYTPLATPILQINSVYASAMGLYQGEEYSVINFYGSRFNQALSLAYPVLRWRKGLRLKYLAGYAYEPTKSTYAVQGLTTEWFVDKWIVGATSGAAGVIVAFDDQDWPKWITIDVRYGKFVEGELLTAQATEFAVGDQTATATLLCANDDNTTMTFGINSSTGTFTAGKWLVGATSGSTVLIMATDSTTYITVQYQGIGVEKAYFTAGETLQQWDSSVARGTSTVTAVYAKDIRRALCEAYPEITLACELEICYLHKHKYDFENQGTYKEQTSRRPDKFIYQLQPEAIALLKPYRRYLA